MTRLLVVYATTDGHTKTICERLAARVAPEVDQVTLVEVEQAQDVALSAFDKIVIGASIRHGRHKASLHRYVEANADALNARPTAFFSVNLVARKPDKNQPDTNPYVRKFLAQSRWRPRAVDVFAGRLDYPHYGTLDRLIIRFIMFVTGGPTDPRTTVEFTDWRRVDAFARRIAAF
jgi:menaquinone-dependent protoporphyrinogen oxidase